MSVGVPEKIQGEVVTAIGRCYLPRGGKDIPQLAEHPVDKAQWGLHQAERLLPLLISPFPFVEPASLSPMSPWGCSVFASYRRWGRTKKYKVDGWFQS